MRRPLLSASADSLPEHSPEVLPEPEPDSEPDSLFMPSLKSDTVSRAPDDDTDPPTGLVFGEEPQ